MLHKTTTRGLLASATAAAFLLSQSPGALAQDSETVTGPEVQISQEMDGAYIVMWASANLRAAPTSQSETGWRICRLAPS